jgi:hypothetical protein
MNDSDLAIAALATARIAVLNDETVTVGQGRTGHEIGPDARFLHRWRAMEWFHSGSAA